MNAAGGARAGWEGGWRLVGCGAGGSLMKGGGCALRWHGRCSAGRDLGTVHGGQLAERCYDGALWRRGAQAPLHNEVSSG
jgi:hypothetical protein